MLPDRPSILLAGDSGNFELSIIGYQFPDADGILDPDWLMIRIDVQADVGRWEKTAPALLTIEVAALANWLGELGDGRPVDEEIDFTEPNLTFECVDAVENDVHLRIWFQLEFRPDYVGGRVVGDRDSCLNLTVTRSQLAKAARDLRRQLYEFPTRVPVD